VSNDQEELFPNRGLIAKLAEEYRFPVVGQHRGFVEAGVLLAYDVNYPNLFRVAAMQIDQIAGNLSSNRQGWSWSST
jgi:ABC-type uncharacterized transport system substrate-binding protein